VEGWVEFQPGKTWDFVWSTDCLTLADLLCIIWVVGGFNPSEKYESNWVHLPQIRDENTKDLSCHQLVLCIIWMYPPQDASGD